MKFSSAMEVLGALVKSYYEERDVEATLACVTDDIEWVGTENNDSASGKEALRQLLIADVAAFSDSFAIEIGEPTVQVISEDAVIITVVGKQVAVPEMVCGFTVRGTINCINTENGWLVNNVHTSVPNAEIEKFSLAQELEKKKRQERAIMSSIPGGVAIYRLKKDGRVATDYVSESLATMCGYSAQEFLDYLKEDSLVNLVPEDIPQLLEIVKDCMEKHKQISARYHIYTKNKEQLFIRLDASQIETEPLLEDDIAIFYAVHTLVSAESQKIISEQKVLNELINQVPAGIGIYEVNNGVLSQTYMNDAYYRMVGSSREDRKNYQGTNTMIAVHPEDAPIIQKAIKKLLDGESYAHVYYRIWIKEDRWFWLNMEAYVAERRENYIKIFAAISDYNKVISSQQAYEEKIRLNELASQNAVATCFYNLTKNQIISFSTQNSELEDLTFNTADEMFASTKKTVPDDEERKQFDVIKDCKTILKAFKKGVTHYEIKHHLMNDNNWYQSNFDILQNPHTGDIEAISTVQDITEHMQTELVVEKLMDIDYQVIMLVNPNSKQTFSIRQKITDPFLDKIMENYQILKDNPEAENAFFDEHSLAENNEKIGGKNRLEQIQKYLETEPYYETIYSFKDGENLKYYRVLYTYLENSKDNILCAIQNVSEEYVKQEKQNAKLAEALEQAEAANRAKTSFLSRVSHDMRTPLNGVLGLTNLMKDEIVSPKALKDLTQLELSAEYLLKLINDTLDVSSIESGLLELHPTVCDSRDVLNNVIKLSKPQMEAKNIKLNVSAESLPMLPIYFDEGRLQQIAMNVLGNAAKFTKPGGRVDFVANHLKVENGISWDEFLIKDNGIGMSEEFLPHIFEPFAQENGKTTASQSGTGLGMAIVNHLVQLKGGEISVESTLGKGTSVRVVLPFPIATEEQIAEWKHAHKPQSTQYHLDDKRVLLCEDHPLNKEITVRLLEKAGIFVNHAENGQIGVEMFMSSPEGYFDAILMDIRMPVMDGIDATRAIRALDRKDAKKIPILALTANALTEDIQSTHAAGMDAHLSKPIEPENLFQTLEHFIGQDEQNVKKRILIVDDIKINRAVLVENLQHEFDIYEAENGKQALEVLKKYHGMDVVITDIQMPEMDGVELIKQIRENEEYRHVVVIANTVYEEQGQEEELLALGANDFMYKPANATVVKLRVKNAMKKF